MAETRTFSQLVKEVGEWSERNFGDQDGLNEVAPFLGVVEELLCETFEARGNRDKILDSFADALIFLADLFYRTGIACDVLFSIDPNESYDQNSGEKEFRWAMGNLARFLLKWRQGIRDADIADISLAAKLLFCRTILYYQDLKIDDKPPLQDLVWSTWEKVKKRDWKKNPENAHEVAES